MALRIEALSPCDHRGVSMLTESREETQERPEIRAPAPRTSSGRTLTLVGVLLAIAIMLALPVRTWFAQQAGLDDLRNEIGAAQQRVDSLEQQQELWADPAYVESQARLRLNYVMRGEIGLMALSSDGGPGTQPGDDLPDTWWGRVWGSVEETSGRRPAEIGAEDESSADQDAANSDE